MLARFQQAIQACDAKQVYELLHQHGSQLESLDRVDLLCYALKIHESTQQPLRRAVRHFDNHCRVIFALLKIIPDVHQAMSRNHENPLALLVPLACQEEILAQLLIDYRPYLTKKMFSPWAMKLLQPSHNDPFYYLSTALSQSRWNLAASLWSGDQEEVDPFVNHIFSRLGIHAVKGMSLRKELKEFISDKIEMVFKSP